MAADTPTPAPSLAERLTDAVLERALSAKDDVFWKDDAEKWTHDPRTVRQISLDQMRTVLVAALSPEPPPATPTPRETELLRLLVDAAIPLEALRLAVVDELAKPIMEDIVRVTDLIRKEVAR